MLDGIAARSEYRGSAARCEEPGVDDAGEAEDGDPLAADGGLPDEFAVEDGGGFGGADIFVEVEVAGVGGLRCGGRG